MTIHLFCSTLALGLAAAPGPKEAEAPPAPKAKVAEATSLADKVQSFYDELEDYSSQFAQTYTRVALSRKSRSSGTIAIKKGGKVRWTYREPAERLFVADGETLWIYEPEEMQVIVDKRFSTEKLGGSIAFLWGEGKLSDAFTVRRLGPKEHDFGKDAAVLELIPKHDRTYARLVIRIDEETGRVKESVVHETSGNTNHFVFTEPKLNQGLADAQFEFVAPAGVDVVLARPEL